MTITRVTFNTRMIQLQYSIGKAQSDYTDALVPATTGKSINNLHDVPELTYKLLNIRSKIAMKETYEKSQTNARHWLDMSDTKIDEAVTLVHRLRELAVSGNNDTLSEADRTNHGAILDNIKAELEMVGNTNVSGRYIFSGATTNVKPFTENLGVVQYNGNSTIISLNVTADMTANVNVDPDTVFMGAGGGENAFDVIDDLKTAITAGDSASIETQLTRIDSLLGQFLQARATIGSQVQRLDSAADVLNNDDERYLTELSDIESADIADVASKLSTYETALKVIFSAATRIMSSTFDTLLGGS